MGKKDSVSQNNDLVSQNNDFVSLNNKLSQDNITNNEKLSQYFEFFFQ